MRYSANSPYPEVTGIKPDRRQAMLLMSGYSGQVSELSTVTQYAYHKIKCEKKQGALFATLQGIFLVETHHICPCWGNALLSWAWTPGTLFTLITGPSAGRRRW